MRRALLPLLILGLLVASATVEAAPGRGRGGDGPPPAAIGQFVVADDSTVTGEHLSFGFSESGIRNFRAQEKTLFDIAIHGDGDDDDEDDERRDGRRGPRVMSEGPLFRVRTENFSFTAHDNPGAVGKLQADGSFTLTFTPGVVLASGEEGSVRFSYGNVTGTARGEHLRIAARSVSGDDGLLIFLNAPRGSFEFHRRDIGEAIVRGHVGAEASFNARVQDDATTTVEQEVVSYGNVTMTTVKAERGNLTVLIEGHGLDGRVLVLNVDGRMLGADRADKLNISLDNETIEHATTLEDALDPDDDGYSPEYYIVYDPAVEAFQLMITVPHYSVHTLTVATLIEVLPPSVTLGIVVGMLVIVPMALVLFRRK